MTNSALKQESKKRVHSEQQLRQTTLGLFLGDTKKRDQKEDQKKESSTQSVKHQCDLKPKNFLKILKDKGFHFTGLQMQLV